MINRDDIEAGDKCYTRDGGCLVAREIFGGVSLGAQFITDWSIKGNFLQLKEYHAHNDHPLDIIRIEKAPKPVVESVEAGFILTAGHCVKVKLLFINGVWDKEKSEQVK